MQAIKDAIDAASSPQLLTVAVVLVLFLAIRFRHLTVRPISILILLLPMAGFLFSLTDPNFRTVVTKPDNVPIVIMVGLVIFLTWYAMRLAVRNDQVLAQGKPLPEEMAGREKVLVWPDLVYIEFIASVLFTVLLVAWSIWLKAPLEEPANPALAPNPSKAPWYFLGLQEMLVYFDPWIAGVFLPGLIIVGLMAVPYIDPNPKGNGYYTFRERPFAVSGFLFGFVVLWVFLIFIGTFLRGPNWNFFGPFEYWDVHKLEPLVNINLSEFLWVKGLRTALPSNWLVRELPGLLLVVAYFAVLPPLLAKTVFRRMYAQMGFIRYNVMAFLLLNMMAMPIKMFLRWTLNLKYIVAIPEFFFNI
jgi:Cytochrome b(C-terminal)/b6/petD